jgi:opacity protein-like surface antigen
MRHDVKVGVLLVGLSIVLLLVPREVSAEWYADAYTGAVFTNNTDLTISNSVGSTSTYQDLRVNHSWTGGARGGYWVDQLDWLGFGLDIFFFRVKALHQVVSVTGPGPTATSTFADWALPVVGVGFDVLRLRAPLLRSEDFPHGRLQPFLSAGPALFVTWAGENRNVQPQGQQGTDVALGAKAEAGVTFLLTKTVGLFTEYRFTHFTSELSYQNTTPSPATEIYQATYDSHQIIGGISFRFP